MFRRREGRGSDNNNETRFAKNTTRNPLTFGDLDNLEILPGKSLDLLHYASVQRIGSSSDLKTAVQAGWVRLSDRDQNIVTVADVCEAIIPAVLRDVESSTASEIIREIETVSGNTTLTAADHDVVLVSATATITLPTAVGLEGYHFIVKNIGLGIVTIATTGSETIDGESTQDIPEQYVSYTFVSDGSNWFIV